MLKLGLIAGGGQLPLDLAKHCQTSGRPFFVIWLKGFAEPVAAFPGAEVGIAEFGKIFATLKREGCKAVCMAGMVRRPDIASLKPDLRGLRAIPAALVAARQGDDALLRFVMSEFESEGFSVEGADSVYRDMTLCEGPLGRLSPTEDDAPDIDLAIKTVEALGALDIGQAAVVAGGAVLAVEAQEGTDAMLARCLTLPESLRGTVARRMGVLVKWPKPIQDRRIDLPVIGVKTVEGAAAAGLAGIVVQAEAALVLDRAAVQAAADRLGLFVVGLRR